MAEYISCPKCNTVFKDYSWSQYAQLQSGICYHCNENLPSGIREKFAQSSKTAKSTLTIDEQILERLTTIKNEDVAIVWFFIVIPIASVLIYQVLRTK